MRKTLKQLKKDLTTDSILTLTFFKGGSHPFLNVSRQVKEIHNNFIVLTDGVKNSRLDLPTSKELIYKDNEFSILDNNEIVMTYRIENLEETENKEKISVRQEKILKILSKADKRINKIYSINDYQAFTDLYSVVFLKDNKLTIEEEKAPETLLNLVKSFNKINYEKHFETTVDDVLKAFNDKDYLKIIFKDKLIININKDMFINCCLFLGLTRKSKISVSSSLSYEMINKYNYSSYTVSKAIKINNLSNADYGYLQVINEHIKLEQDQYNTMEVK